MLKTYTSQNSPQPRRARLLMDTGAYDSKARILNIWFFFMLSEWQRRYDAGQIR